MDEVRRKINLYELWDVNAGKQVKIINMKVAGKSILFSNDGREFGVVTNDGVRYYAVTSGMLLRFAPGAKWPTWTK